MVQHFEESSDDDEAIENETMEWRRNRLEREEFIQQQVCEIILSKMLLFIFSNTGIQSSMLGSHCR